VLILSMHAAFKRMIPVVFEKDDDDNGHIDFISAASVCYSLMGHWVYNV